jgi:hypothetical protein
VSDPNGADPRLLWLQPGWRATATDWIRARLQDRGLTQNGEIEQPHVRWWSTVIRVPTNDGDLFFKASARVHAFEPALIALLARLQPDTVPELVAADTERGWMLMRDGGTRLRELVHSPADLCRWEELLPAYAELQLTAAPHVEEALAVGVPDERLAVLPAHLDRLLDDEEALMVGRPEGLTAHEHRRLRELAPSFAETCEALAADGLPETVQHDDLHDGNVFVRDGGYVVFDWGDSCLSHPFHTLVVTLRAIAHRLDLRPGGPELIRLRDAYLEPFSRYGQRHELAVAAELAHVTGTAARAIAWHRFVSAREPGFRGDDPQAVPYGLRRLLAPAPIGSWS